MRTPRWSMAAALLFWGWQTGSIAWSMVMALGLEASALASARWEFKEVDVNRICDLCWILVLGAVLILGATEDHLVFIFKFVQWLPLCFFPIILAQTCGRQEVMPLSAFYGPLRRGRQSCRTFHISFAYFILCVAAASASTRPNGFFYVGIALLVLLALASVRPRHVSLLVWVLLAMLAVWSGQICHRRLRALQNNVEVALGSWISEFFQQSPDMYERRTRIGQTGLIQQSRKVLLRVRVPPGQIPPSLLRDGVFDIYTNHTWYVTSNYTAPVPVRGAEGTFHLLPTKPGSAEVEIASSFDGGRGPLALPHGVFEIDGLAANLRTNDLGVCSIEGGPGLVIIRAHYGGGVSLDALPGPSDTQVPENEKPGLEKIVRALKLREMPERQRIRAVTRFFRDHFAYSLYIPPNRYRKSGMTELEWFLSRQGRYGHCEYFATATVLLLRQAGVPARYVTGYAVPESARHGDTYLVRGRHQHAWALAYHSDDTHIWEQIDTTPPGRDQAEAQPAWWEAALDFLSNVAFTFSKWRWSRTAFARGVEWLLTPLILYLVWRILSTQRRRRAHRSAADLPLEPSWPGLDSELFLIHRRLSGGRFARLANESLADWQKRLETASPASSSLTRVFQLHRRLRFDPRGLAAAERELLKREAESWLLDFAALERSAAGVDLRPRGGV
jgi:transglutaminase-like putative cysteine protease